MALMRIGIIDADLLDNGTRHPNLALMKISGFNKEQGHSVTFLSSYVGLESYDKVYISKVFTFTNVPKDITLNLKLKKGERETLYQITWKS